MRLDPAEFVDGWLLFAPQYYERDELSAITSSLRRGDIFADIGAHVGMYALQAARAVGDDGTVIAVEPNPSSARELRYNVALNGLKNICVIEVAAASSASVRRLAQNVVTNRASASLVDGQHHQVDVVTRPLSEILREAGVERVDVVKLDIEGAEEEVLSAYFAEVPSPRWPRLVLTEHYEEFVTRVGDVLALLRSHGYVQRARWGRNYLFTRSV